MAAEPRQQPTAREQARTVTIFHKPVVMLQATFGYRQPRRAGRAGGAGGACSGC
ncbi:hypothetical protein, partial [Klebsiella pneumoniae]|uniref:hypothetical protein n=1 Tax=Klebsiella pneumoniae TaxID=573 RepID=UPI003F79CCBD